MYSIITVCNIFRKYCMSIHVCICTLRVYRLHVMHIVFYYSICTLHYIYGHIYVYVIYYKYAIQHTYTLYIGDINLIISERMREEMMVGYCAAITFVDKQVWACACACMLYTTFLYSMQSAYA